MLLYNCVGDQSLSISMLYTPDLKQQNHYGVKLQTLSAIQPYAHVQILRNMQLHPGLTEWVMDLPP